MAHKLVEILATSAEDQVIVKTENVSDEAAQAKLGISSDKQSAINDALIEAIEGKTFTQTQADWSQTDENQVDYIKNKPTIPAAQVQSNWTQTNTNALDYIKNKPTIPTVNNKTITIKQGDTTLGSFTLNQTSNKTITIPKGFDGDYNSLTNTPDIPVNTSDLYNDSGYITGYTEQDPVFAASPAASITDDDIQRWNSGGGSVAQVQADWNTTDTTSASYINNKPVVAPQRSQESAILKNYRIDDFGYFSTYEELQEAFRAAGKEGCITIGHTSDSMYGMIGTDSTILTFEQLNTQYNIPIGVLLNAIDEIESSVAAKYTKPSTGIPKTDLASAVQTSLGKADTALQTHQSLTNYAKKTDLGGYITTMDVVNTENGDVTITDFGQDYILTKAGALTSLNITNYSNNALNDNNHVCAIHFLTGSSFTFKYDSSMILFVNEDIPEFEADSHYLLTIWCGIAVLTKLNEI